MNLNEFENWLNQIEKDVTPPDLDSEKMNQFKNLLHNKITALSNSSGEQDSDKDINVEEILAAFNPAPSPSIQRPARPKKGISFLLRLSQNSVYRKIAILFVICLIFINLSVVVYATVEKYYGVHKATPEFEAQVDVPNDTELLLDNPSGERTEKMQDKYAHTDILKESSFNDASFYNVITDVLLTPDKNNAYTSESFIFNSYDIAAFKKENNNGWTLNQGEKIDITLAIDTSFAACEPEGEYIEVAYILDGKYIPFTTQKINDTSAVLSFTAPETGEYYFGIANMSLSYIKITELKIK